MNSTPNEPTTDDDPRVLRAVQEYLAEREAGRSPDRRAFAARYPELREAMAPYLDALDAMHAGTPLLNQSAEGRPAPAAAEPYPAEPLGDFRIVREVGRGGMGVVYEAVQLSLGRRVALKVLPFAAALDARQLQRFKNEAQAAAQLHHTNIVPVHAVGCERGVHYYAMQLIEGQNLAALVEELRRGEAPRPERGTLARPGAESTGPYVPPRPLWGRGDGGEGVEGATPSPPSPHPRNGGEGRRTSPAVPVTETGLGAQLTTQRSNRTGDFFRTVARLVAQAAEGLDYAHGLGIVHRDVKPANLLVDARGNIWITDFGLAQFHADANLTQSGDLLGTLRYMSPEQAGGQRVPLDHRTDVYSLGATLYELLTLRPIFDGADRQALLRQILNDEPQPPRSVNRAVPAELETIVLKAVSKAPAERYTTARDFADDLNRFLRDEPIHARRPTLAQRARKWFRRHPSVLIAGTILLVLLTAGSLVSAGFIQAAYQGEQRRAREAEEQFQLARQTVDDMVQLAEAELADNPRLRDLRKRLLESAVVYYQKFIDQRGDNPATREGLRDTKARVEQILADLAFLQGAGQLQLLGNKAVLNNLHLTDDQRTKMTELTTQMDKRRIESLSDYHKLTAAERERRFLELARANDEAVRQVLSVEQLQRLRQIALQFQGPGAFRDSEVTLALKLTAQQKERIQAIEATAFGFPERPPGGPGSRPPVGPGGPSGPSRPPGGRPDDFQKFHEEQRKAYEVKLKAAGERIQTVLNDEQRKQWREMIGEPFKGPMPMLFFGPPHSFALPGPPGPRDRKLDGNPE